MTRDEFYPGTYYEEDDDTKVYHYEHLGVAVEEYENPDGSSIAHLPFGDDMVDHGYYQDEDGDVYDLNCSCGMHMVYKDGYYGCPFCQSTYTEGDLRLEHPNCIFTHF